MSYKYKFFNEAIQSGVQNASFEYKPPLNSYIKHKESLKNLSVEQDLNHASKNDLESQSKLSLKSSLELEIDNPNNSNIIRENSKSSLSPQSKQLLNRVNSTKSDKNFVDLNKSLAKLASRRIAGHSPDNSHAKYPKEVSKNLQFQVNALSSKKSWEKSPQDTPKRPFEKQKNSSKKELDMTPEMYYEKGINKNNLLFAPNIGKKDALGSSMELNKQKIISENLSKDRFSRFHTEANRPNEYNEYESKNLAKFFMQGGFFTEGCEDTSENVIEIESETPSEKKNVKNMDSDKINMRKYQAYKKNMRNPKIKKQVQILNTEPNQNYSCSIPKIPKPKKMVINTEPSETTIRIERFYTQLEEANRKLNENDFEGYEQLNLNAISDGVEYSSGGVGYSAAKDRAKKSRLLGMRDSNSKINGPKYKMKNSEPEKVQSWKSELISIKREIENRKHSFDEVNKFVSQLYEDDYKHVKPVLDSKEKKENVPESAEKPSDEHPICKINLGRLKLESTLNIGPTAKCLNSNLSMSGINPKMTQELRTTTDGNEEKSPLESKGENSPPHNLAAHNRSSFCEFTYETNEMNTSFADNNGLSKDYRSKPACCGYSKCHIF